ncbi:MAG TPA: HAD-IA family hydrolase [Propionibacterium sp.]|jgi:HAD superfamily hydrolase (TIGR01509 family)|nr:HAD-IA family hydrolase [Propionibacterium sp.]
MRRIRVTSVIWDNFRAALLDLDGVITPTADVHMAAWAHLFTAYLAERGVRAYTDSDYFDYLDGKPRYAGVQTLLASRGIELPYGDPADAPTAETVCGLGNRKDAVFNETLAGEGIKAYPGSLRLLDFFDERGIVKAVVSSSKNARGVLTAAGIIDRFPVIVDGLVAAERGIAGKPAPDMFWLAADQLGVPREQSVVFEDALSGVRAGAAGGFGLVVGVDRGTGADRLREAGAEVVVTDLDQLI